jgi:hypothetical protein
MKFHREQTGRYPVESACEALQDRVAELESATRIGDEDTPEYVVVFGVGVGVDAGVGLSRATSRPA